jgi:formylglycine-generating enzyme required for sulfatase activity
MKTLKTHILWPMLLAAAVAAGESSPVYAQATFEIKLPTMVELPGGCTEVGTMLMDNRGNQPREVCLDAFAISSHEVSIVEFKAFLRSTGLPAPSPALEILAHELPVTSITWFDAMAYTHWLSEYTGDTYSLPSEEQWEYAAQAYSSAGAICPAAIRPIAGIVAAAGVTSAWRPWAVLPPTPLVYLICMATRQNGLWVVFTIRTNA